MNAILHYGISNRTQEATTDKPHAYTHLQHITQLHQSGLTLAHDHCAHVTVLVDDRHTEGRSGLPAADMNQLGSGGWKDGGSYEVVLKIVTMPTC